MKILPQLCLSEITRKITQILLSKTQTYERKNLKAKKTAGAINETACFQGHFLRVPVFVNKASEKVKTFFSETTLSPSFFLLFPRSKFSDFCQNNLKNKAQKTISVSSSIDTRATAKYPP